MAAKKRRKRKKVVSILGASHKSFKSTAEQVAYLNGYSAGYSKGLKDN
jgi:hypothetical protein